MKAQSDVNEVDGEYLLTTGTSNSLLHFVSTTPSNGYHQAAIKIDPSTGYATVGTYQLYALVKIGTSSFDPSPVYVMDPSTVAGSSAYSPLTCQIPEESDVFSCNAVGTAPGTTLQWWTPERQSDGSYVISLGSQNNDSLTYFRASPF